MSERKLLRTIHLVTAVREYDDGTMEAVPAAAIGTGLWDGNVKSEAGGWGHDAPASARAVEFLAPKPVTVRVGYGRGTSRAIEEMVSDYRDRPEDPDDPYAADKALAEVRETHKDRLIEGLVIEEHTFATRGEADAYYQGATDMDGWGESIDIPDEDYEILTKIIG